MIHILNGGNMYLIRLLGEQLILFSALFDTICSHLMLKIRYAAFLILFWLFYHLMSILTVSLVADEA